MLGRVCVLIETVKIKNKWFFWNARETKLQTKFKIECGEGVNETNDWYKVNNSGETRDVSRKKPKVFINSSKQLQSIVKEIGRERERCESVRKNRKWLWYVTS